MKLSTAFYARSACEVAQALLGQRLVHIVNGQRLSGVIVETEAYCNGETQDSACHGARNQGRPTARTAVMYGAPAHIYIYLNYGIHWMLNVVTDKDNTPGAVLIRAIDPSEGLQTMAANRDHRPKKQWTNGPGKLTKAFRIDDSLHGASLVDDNARLWIEQGDSADFEVATGPRVGLGKTAEPWFSTPWRYWISGNPYVSKYR